MIYGIIASEEEFLQSALPLGPVAVGTFDFVNGLYDWDGTTLTAADVVDQTGWIGASGLVVPVVSAAAKILYSATVSLLTSCQFTVVAEIEITNTDSNTDVLTVSNAGAGYYIELEVRGGTGWNAYDYGGISRDAYPADQPALGIHKVAMTRVDAAISISADGNTVAVDTTDISAAPLPVPGYPMVNCYLGGWFNWVPGGITIRSLSVYDPQSDSVLPSLSVI